MKHCLHLLYGLCLYIAFSSLPLAIAQDVYTDNVVIVLDGSGSMEGNMRDTDVTKMDAAKTAIMEVMKTIPQSTHVGLVAFGGNANQWLYPLGLRDDAQIFSALQGIHAEGGTPLGYYMKLGADALLEAREKQYGYGSYRLLVVTDGEAGDKDLVNSYTPEIIARGITVDVIGVDMSQDHTLATRVNSYRRANDPASLKAAIEEVFAEVENNPNPGSDDTTFDELKNIPDAILISIINAMHKSGNHPIASDDHLPFLTGASSTTSSQPSGTQNRDDGFSWIMFFFIAVIGWGLYNKFKH